MQQLSETLGVPLFDTDFGEQLTIEAEVMQWIPSAFSIGSVQDGEFTSISGRWKPKKIMIEIIGHELSTEQLHSESTGDVSSEMSLPTDATGVQVPEALLAAGSDASSQRSALTTRSLSVISNPKHYRRRKATKEVLEGKFTIIDATRKRGVARPAVIDRQVIDIDTLDTVGRFDVPTERSVPFLLTEEELLQHAHAKDDVGEDSTAKQSTSTGRSTELVAAGGKRKDNSTKTSSSDQTTTTKATGSSAAAASSTSSNNSKGVASSVTDRLAGSLSALSNARAINEIQKAVKKITNHRRIVYTWGTIGLKFCTREGKWFYIAFHSTNVCYMWTNTIRKVMISQLQFQTFYETEVSKFLFDTKLLTHRPNDKQLVDYIIAQGSALKTKTKDPRHPPGDGVITLKRAERVNKWKVFLDEMSTPDKARNHPQIIHLVKLGKTLVEMPRNRLLRLTRRHASSQEIDLRICSIYVPRPYSSQLFLKQRDRMTGVEIQLEILADSLENRIAWEEWMQQFGAVKVLSEEELIAKNHILGVDEFHEAEGGTGGASEDSASVATATELVSPVMQRMRSRSSGNRASSVQSTAREYFAWSGGSASRQSFVMKSPDSVRSTSRQGSLPPFSASRAETNKSPMTNSFDSSFEGDGSQPRSVDIRSPLPTDHLSGVGAPVVYVMPNALAASGSSGETRDPQSESQMSVASSTESYCAVQPATTKNGAQQVIHVPKAFLQLLQAHNDEITHSLKPTDSSGSHPSSDGSHDSGPLGNGNDNSAITAQQTDITVANLTLTTQEEPMVSKEANVVAQDDSKGGGSQQSDGNITAKVACDEVMQQSAQIEGPSSASPEELKIVVAMPSSDDSLLLPPASIEEALLTPVVLLSDKNQKHQAFDDIPASPSNGMSAVAAPQKDEPSRSEGLFEILPRRASLASMISAPSLDDDVGLFRTSVMTPGESVNLMLGGGATAAATADIDAAIPPPPSPITSKRLLTRRRSMEKFTDGGSSQSPVASPLLGGATAASTTAPISKVMSNSNEQKENSLLDSGSPLATIAATTLMGTLSSDCSAAVGTNSTLPRVATLSSSSVTRAALLTPTVQTSVEFSTFLQTSGRLGSVGEKKEKLSVPVGSEQSPPMAIPSNHSFASRATLAAPVVESSIRSLSSMKLEFRQSLTAIAMDPMLEDAYVSEGEQSAATSPRRIVQNDSSSDSDQRSNSSEEFPGIPVSTRGPVVSSPRICVLCGQDKVMAGVCSKTGRKHAQYSGGSAPPGGLTPRKGVPLPRAGTIRNPFSPVRREPLDVRAAKILLELN